ncbi:hypothetical protein M8494_27515 [Serratia ureilytica]
MMFTCPTPWKLFNANTSFGSMQYFQPTKRRQQRPTCAGQTAGESTYL